MILKLTQRQTNALTRKHKTCDAIIADPRLSGKQAGYLRCMFLDYREWHAINRALTAIRKQRIRERVR